MMIQMLILMALISADQRSPLASYRWENRIVVINEQMQDAGKQLAALLEQQNELRERDLLVFLKKGNELICQNADESNLVVTGNRYTGVTLIGKDGGIKMQKDQLVEVKLIFDLIDSMPMRQSEMRKKSNQ